MVVGLLRLEIQLPGAASLKDKRRVLQSLTQRLHNQFRVAVAEVGHHEHRGLAELAVACVSTETSHAHQVLTQVASAVERSSDCVLADFTIEMR